MPKRNDPPQQARNDLLQTMMRDCYEMIHPFIPNHLKVIIKIELTYVFYINFTLYQNIIQK
ncbi:hypothetical protein CD134_01435 [Staphylococcus lutrae]|uniref:Uncharacterized protein n=1 Tax=Staphylococcus lutrae TaxID=155085 RepID=A0AAC9RUN3_9STAP|nr:hypothetical protein B5P37_08105 [Staphylococcus lutrae]PNZ39521.1 hypothetical protein CD134_01435 [Staphylococcus lutrae]